MYFFLVYPTLNVFRMSLFDWNGLGNAPSFIGLDNFAALVHDPTFVRAFENTLFILVVVTIVTILQFHLYRGGPYPGDLGGSWLVPVCALPAVGAVHRRRGSHLLGSFRSKTTDW